MNQNSISVFSWFSKLYAFIIDSFFFYKKFWTFDHYAVSCLVLFSITCLSICIDIVCFLQYKIWLFVYSVSFLLQLLLWLFSLFLCLFDYDDSCCGSLWLMLPCFFVFLFFTDPSLYFWFNLDNFITVCCLCYLPRETIPGFSLLCVSSCFFMVHDASWGCQCNDTTLPEWEQIFCHFSWSFSGTRNLGLITLANLLWDSQQFLQLCNHQLFQICQCSHASCSRCGSRWPWSTASPLGIVALQSIGQDIHVCHRGVTERWQKECQFHS